ncbi:MAG: 2-C-methyl-D-erythritol 2,4-cyclodiphosphate synthase [Desulfosoma sp.]
MTMNLRIGMGWDVHAFAEGRPLVLGGVTIPFDRGLLGHSDADVLCHALCDALLGAAALGDIGIHFPDSDSQYRGVSSLVLLGAVRDLIRQAGYGIVNVDVTVLAQKPKIAPYILPMRRTLARILEVAEDAVSVKATTTEGLGFVGRQEGIAACAVALLHRQQGAAS